MIHRVIVAIIFLLIFASLFGFFNLDYSKFLGKFYLKLLKFRNVKVNNIELFNKVFKSDRKCLIIANHRCLLDVSISKIVFKNIGWIASKNAVKICPLGELLAKNSQTIIIEKNATATLNEKIKNRKANDNLIMIFADAMNPILPGYNIAPFKTGGFVGKFDILPIVIKYKNYTVDPTYRWFDGEHPFIGFSKIALNDHIDVTLDVMDIQSCESNMSIEEYRDKVYNLMNKRYDEL